MVINGVTIPDKPQTGAWYSGRQAWQDSSGQWTLSDPGAINPLSNQVGAGQPVSQEVVQQTDPNNWNYIQQEQAKAAANPITPAIPTPAPAPTFNDSAQATGGGMGAGISPQPSINLPELYKSLYQDAGIKERQEQYSQMEKEFIDAKGAVNDNPFLSEATRVGRVAKLEQLFNERTANIRGEIETRKADVETQLNLQMKQFDINSQVARDALNQFNTLLGLGALDNASGEDIAAITRTTGIPSSMIYSAIEESKKSKIKPANTQVITSTNDAGVVTATVINQDTGEVVKQTSLGSIGNVQTGTGKVSETDYVEILKQDISSGATLNQLFQIYSGYLDPDTILQIYNSGSPYGPAKEDYKTLQQYGVTPPKSSSGVEAPF